MRVMPVLASDALEDMTVVVSGYGKKNAIKSHTLPNTKKADTVNCTASDPAVSNPLEDETPETKVV